MTDTIEIRRTRRLGGRTKLERRNPALVALASTVLPEQHIRWHGGAYWLGDLQLTYDRDVTDGRNVVLDEEANARLAERILRKTLEAREQPAWGTRVERQERILVGLQEEVIPSFRDGCYCHWRHPSLDDGWLTRSPFTGMCFAGMRLVDETMSHEAEGRTFESAIDALRASLVAKPRLVVVK